MVGQLSGSQGNTTFSHNRSGSYIRNRVIPVNPNTTSQTAARSAFTSFSQNWRDLSQSDQSSWVSLADIDPIEDRQGQSIVLSGIAYYTRFNMRRRSVALARLDTAPALVEVPPAVTAATFVLSGGGDSMAWTPTVSDGSATNFQQLLATPPVSNGINFFGRGDFRNFDLIAGTDPAVPPEQLEIPYAVVFGTGWNTSVGMKIAIRAYGVSDSGFVGDFLQVTSVIGA